MDEIVGIFLIFICAMCFFIGAFFNNLGTKEKYCKHKYEKHLEVEECRGKNFPWELK